VRTRDPHSFERPLVSRPRELPPQPLAESGVNLAAHRAPTVPTVNAPLSGSTGACWIDTAMLQRVLTEEYGHHLDRVPGGPDAAGDEGAIFAQSLMTGGLDAATLGGLQAEQDQGFIVRDGQRTAVEFYDSGHSYGGSSPSPSPTPSSETGHSYNGSTPPPGGDDHPYTTPVPAQTPPPTDDLPPEEESGVNGPSLEGDVYVGIDLDLCRSAAQSCRLAWWWISTLPWIRVSSRPAGRRERQRRCGPHCRLQLRGYRGRLHGYRCQYRYVRGQLWNWR